MNVKEWSLRGHWPVEVSTTRATRARVDLERPWSRLIDPSGAVVSAWTRMGGLAPPPPPLPASVTVDLPVRIEVVGFLVNTIVYGLALREVVLLPLAVRGWIRRRGGRCVGCGYEVGELAVCPECGRNSGGGAAAQRKSG